MSEKKILIALALVTFFIIGGGVFFIGNTTTSAQIAISRNVKATVSQKDYEFGTVKMKNGNVVKRYTITNSGIEVLKLANIKTSCHCTKAFITIGNQESPRFGMTDVSSWIGEVNPGKTAELTVVFDPAYHGQNGVGQINRFISVETNDASNQKLTFSLNGVVIQ